jgi:hypothetical protein
MPLASFCQLRQLRQLCIAANHVPSGFSANLVVSQFGTCEAQSRDRLVLYGILIEPYRTSCMAFSDSFCVSTYYSDDGTHLRLSR